MDKAKVKRLEKHAQEMGYEIDYEATKRMKEAFSNSTITIRVPSELKDRLKAKAKKLNIPYQRYIKSVLIESLKKV